MTKFVTLILSFLLLLACSTSAQEVFIYDFPLGVAGSVDPEIFKPHYDDLKAIADTLHKYPLVRAVIIGGADGERYRQNNDAKNPSLALGRAHALLNVLATEFDVDSTRFVIRTEDSKMKGGQYRFAGVRIAWEFEELDTELSNLRSLVDTLSKRPPVEKHFTEIREVPSEFVESFGLQFSVGMSSSPFGGIPIAGAAVMWQRFIMIEGLVGHTFWDGTYRFGELDFDTRRRLIGGHAIIYPFERVPLGFVGGWLRVEEVAQDYYEYTRLSEGLVLGARISPLEFLSVTAAYNPSKERIASSINSKAKNDQFLIYLTAHIAIGGGK